MDHTVTAYESELRELTTDVERLGRMAVRQLRAALDVVHRRPGQSAEEVVAEDKNLNAVAREIEAKAVRLIALRQPMADDLRHAIAALKGAIDLERCGDLAKSTAKRSLRMDAPVPPALAADLERLGTLAAESLERVLEALVDADVDAARAVWRADDEIDAAHEKLVRDVLSHMTENPGMTGVGAQLLYIAKNLERIGDHATNVAELVCYEATGSTDLGG